MTWNGLPFDEIWVLDFEFIAPPGARQEPVCLVAREIITGRLIRLFREDLNGTPPFQTGRGALFVAYFSSAEWGCFAALGWPMPERVLDLYVEFRAATNGTVLPAGRGLLGALVFHRIASITKEQKDAGRELVMKGAPWSEADRRDILDYCQTDVDSLKPLLLRMIPGIRASREGLGQALLRGRYCVAVARMEHTGIPIDVPQLSTLRAQWQEIKLSLIRDIDVDFDVYDETSFRANRFAAYLERQQMSWPRTSTGALRLDQDTFRDMARTYPHLSPLKELRHALSDLRLEDLAVGPDGRNRTLLSPFGAKTGRNTTSTTKFIFGPSVWLRGLIKPPPGRGLAYVDWSAQEVAIAAALSDDAPLQDAVQSGDPYLAFAVQAGLAPSGATKRTHSHVRDMCKACFLGANYGMGAESLAVRCNMSTMEAKELLRKLARTYPAFTAWSQHNVDAAMLTGKMQSTFGWPLQVTGQSSPNSLRNFPMQANGAEMLRLACCLATEAGVAVCAPIHDALLVEGPLEELDAVITRTQTAMREASALTLGGFEVATSVNTVAYPQRFTDPRGSAMWQHVTALTRGGSPDATAG